MNKEEMLEHCIRQLRELEEQEFQFISYERRAQQMVEEAFFDMQAMMSKYDDYDILPIVRRQLDILESDFLNDLHGEKRQLIRRIEDAEDEYRRLIFQIEEGK